MRVTRIQHRSALPRAFRAAVIAGLACLAPFSPARAQEPEAITRAIKEGYPEDMAVALNNYDSRLKSASDRKLFATPFSILVPAIQRWDPGSTVVVAFSGGTPALYKQIEDAASVWTAPGVANLKLQFKDASGAYNVWSKSATTRRAHIRIAFDESGYWSSIGTGSVDPTLPGGRLNEASMSLQGFDEELPAGWEGIVRHEFGHALGFHHEHQSPSAGCDFKFANDPGYRYTQDSEDYYTRDKEGRWPGLYTVFGGKRNYWSKKRVDENMKPIRTSSAFIVGPYDPSSIMKYSFEPWELISGEKSKCYTGRPAVVLSAEDIKGARAAYPTGQAAIDKLLRDKAGVLRDLEANSSFSFTLKESTTNRLEPALQ